MGSFSPYLDFNWWPLIENIRKAHLKKRHRFLFLKKIGDPLKFDGLKPQLAAGVIMSMAGNPRGRSPWRWLVRWEHHFFGDFFVQKVEGLFHDFPGYSREFLGKDSL